MMGDGRRFQLRPDHPIRNGGFALFVAVVLVFTLMAATYQPEDPLLHPSSSSPSSKLTSFLTSTSNATFLSDVSVLRTGEDFQNSSSPSASNHVAEAAPFIKLSDLENPTDASSADGECDRSAPVDCANLDLFHLMMRAAIENFPDIHFYRFGKPAAVPGADDSCDMAWRFRPRDATRPTFYKDYRRFHITRSDNCTLIVSKIGDYHSGVNARKRRRSKRRAGGGESGAEVVFEPKKNEAATAEEQKAEEAVPIVGEAINDTLPVIESESTFSAGKYLVYAGGGDRCKSMNHYLWSFLCALGEAQYLNRTLVMDLNICLSSIYTGTGQDIDGKDFRFYFDFEHLKDSTSVIDQRQFWMDWGKWEKKDKLKLHFVDDLKVTPMKLAGVKDTLIMRKFGDVEPDNYWYRVCEGETESVIQRPWHHLWKSRRLMEIVSAISSRLSWDFDSVHIVRGDKARNTQLWPNLARDTSPEALLSTLSEKIENGRRLYIATNEPYTSFFDPLKDKYTTYFLDDFKDLWNETSEWYAETKELNGGNPVEFDGYMRVEVDTEVFLRGKKQLETFNDLTSDCKDGVNTCPSSS
ncbi:hypothetical protein Cni_G14537 [Canna indica]|uniref:O-fucosyltransferase family protein n=1 Tax=Canna indica TaxID=4628 RepID=A0AAQ3QDS2_9LILI|nr:hypothetical protein Cni_G14537 [Canna indica]